MGIFANLDTESYQREYTDRQLLSRMTVYFYEHLRGLVIISVLLAIIAVTAAATPLILARSVDIIQDADSNQIIYWVSLLIFTAGVISWFANWLRRRLTVRMVGDIERSLRVDAFQAAISHDLSFYDKYSSGRVVSRITTDTRDFGHLVILITDLISQVIQSIILGIALIRTEWRLSLYLFIFMPLVFLIAISFRRMARAVTRQGMQAMASVNAAIKETVSGISIAKNFRQETAIYEFFNSANQQSYQVNVRRGLILSLIFPVLDAVSGLGIGVLVYMGGMNVVQGLVTAGAWFLFLQSLNAFFFPVLNISSFWSQIQTGLSAAERVFALIDAQSSVHQIDTLPPPELKGAISFRNVIFRYNEQQQVLDDFSLDIHPGETLALVGHTGAGKSSIARLIARFYEFQDGKILIDGQDIRTFELATYRKQLGIVSQAPFLFNGTIAENISYACPGSTDLAAIERIAHQIGNGEWLQTLPRGLQTQVGERGARLSMGQRQLVSMLRVLVQKPAIFILDEATASIDPFTEWQIQQALTMILAKTTSILIAHRLSTVKAADRILVLEKGRIIEEGNHTSLIQQNGHYAKLYNTYFRHQSLDYRPPGLEEYLKEKVSY